jgi:uncharacterized protein (TIGR02596 family)
MERQLNSVATTPRRWKCSRRLVALLLPATGRRRQARAFSLIEILAVVAIAAILMALIAPSVTSLMESNNLTQGGQVLADQINSARQLAAARNQPVEVRLIEIPDNSGAGYTAIQLWMSKNGGAPAPSTRMLSLPQSVVIAEKAALSGILQNLTRVTTKSASDDPATKVPYTAFQIRPDGIVTPSVSMSQAFLTVVSARFATETDITNVKNYVTVQINPVTATPIVYRP